ncbi:MAG: type II toxin-antitoxin system ParD family antitoxin [Scytonematopsis contorta HA4267-MV1]|jgi:antitoxin ParD1/3/4|nr:type II toxin-antitoxin system ParD family antitoxin [Scytonematopsis contorta HA4267-MV1]
MSIILTQKQEKFIQAKLQTGKYRTAQEILEFAFRLLDEYEQADSDWANSVREKIDAAIAVSEHTPPVEGKAFVNQILEQLNSSCRMG